MKNVYKSLNEQKLYYEQELIRKKNVLKDTKEERKNITIKKIHGELYYYAQCKRAGKVNSQYLGPVIPGTIADIEEKLGVEVPEFYYRPQGMVFKGYSIKETSGVAKIKYTYEESNIFLYIDEQKDEKISNVNGLSGDEKEICTMQIEGIEIFIKEIEDLGDDSSTYTANWNYRDVAYQILGKVDLDEFKKIIKYMKF